MLLHLLLVFPVHQSLPLTPFPGHTSTMSRTPGCWRLRSKTCCSKGVSLAPGAGSVEQACRCSSARSFLVMAIPETSLRWNLS